MSIINEARVPQAMPDPMTNVSVSAKDELDVWVMGEGTPVVFVHGAMMRDFLKPLADELTRRGGYQAIHYSRRGHGGAGLPADSADIPRQATDVVAVLDALRVEKAHVAGHSFGAAIALELATRAPDRLLSTILLEAPLLNAATQQDMTELEEAMALVADKYTSGDTEGAVSTLCEFTSGVQGAMELIEPVLPAGARELAAADLNTWLQVDLPAVGSWMADPATVREITTPIAWIGGADSSQLFTNGRAILREWLPTTRAVDVAGAGHYFPLLKPSETAAALHELLRSPVPAQ